MAVFIVSVAVDNDEGAGEHPDSDIAAPGISDVLNLTVRTLT